MKVLSLYLKNLKHIESGLGKYEVFLDFTNIDKTINVIIGEMGSCKTVILGHLQPFATFGSLDVRNRDGVIIPEMDGQKTIIYSKNGDIYKINHEYKWNKTTNAHNVKSYVEKNGEELNPNGNTTSFLSIIEMEFGIDQSALRILRLGPNVANLIEMKSTERKAYIASLLKEADMYTWFYKKIMDEIKVLTSQTSLLSNKLHHIGFESEEAIEQEYEELTEKLESLNKQYVDTQAQISVLEAQFKNTLRGMSPEEFRIVYNEKVNLANSYVEELDEVESRLDEYKNYPSITEVSKSIGRLDSDITNTQTELHRETDHYMEMKKELSILIDKRKVSGNKDHIQRLRESQKDLLEETEELRQELYGFSCNYTSSHIMNIIGDLNTLDILLHDIAEFPQDLVAKCYNSDNSIIGWSRKQVDMLNGKKYNIQQKMNNIRYSASYENPCIMYLPPLCPTKSCPYYKSHPFTIKESLKSKKGEEELQSLLHQIEKIDAEIVTLQDIPTIYSKIQTASMLWKKHTPIIRELGALETESLFYALTRLDSRVWYNYDKLVRCVELCEKNEKYNNLVSQLKTIDTELALIEGNGTNYDELIEEYENTKLPESSNRLEELDAKLKQLKEELESYNDIYLKLSKKNELDNLSQTIAANLKDVNKECEEMSKILSSIDEDIEASVHMKSTAMSLKQDIQDTMTRKEKLGATISDIRYTKKEFESILKDKEYLEEIAFATSSKQGIPLVLIEVFLNNCKDILNDLIADVFGDSIEILKFKLDENEFSIPYLFNGKVVDDISKASQGQKAVISMALSFALVQRTGIEYNIILLDEMDGPLYKQIKSKFFNIILKHMQTIQAEQAFIISHSISSFEGYPINIIMTTEENIDKTPINNIMRV